jgi:hypothetical protein
MYSLIEREYDDLRSHRVALRRQRDYLIHARSCAPQRRYGVDGYDNALAMTEAALRGTERRWAELCTLLRKPLPGPPVQLNVPTRPRSTTTRSAGPVYLTRMMGQR